MNSKYGSYARFVIRMTLFSVVFSMLNSSSLVIKPWMDATLAIVVFLMKLMGIPASVDGYYVSTTLAGEPFGFFIDWDCVGWKSMFLFLSLILSTPGTSPRSFLKSFIFLPILYILNIARIIGVLAVVDMAGIGYFDAVHGLLFGVVPTLYTLASWIVWVKIGNGN